MRWLIAVFVLLAVATAGVYGAGSALPQEIVTIRGAQFTAANAPLWQAISDFQSFPEWNDAVVAVEPIPDPASDKTLWHLTDTYDRATVLDVLQSVEPSRLVTQSVESDLPWTVRWEIELQQNESGTWVRQKETAIVPSPFMRFFLYYIVGADAGIRAYLQGLGHHFDEQVQVQELAL